MRERLAVAAYKPKSQKDSDNKLPRVVELAVGAKVMVTFNVDTDLDLTNGARGVVHAIVLDEDEAPSICLRYQPKYILVRLDRTRVPRLTDLPERVVPMSVRTY